METVQVYVDMFCALFFVCCLITKALSLRTKGEHLSFFQIIIEGNYLRCIRNSFCIIYISIMIITFSVISKSYFICFRTFPVPEAEAKNFIHPFSLFFITPTILFETIKWITSFIVNKSYRHGCTQF